MKALTRNLTIYFILFIAITPLEASIGNLPAQNTKITASDAQLLLKTDTQETLKRFKQLGPDRVPFLLEILKIGHKLSLPTRLALISIIADTPGQDSSLALIQLLQSTDTSERGQTIKLLAKYPYKEAIPKIIALLDDKAIFAVQVSTDPYTEIPVRINDLALETLRSLAGKKLAHNESKEKQILAWKKWWQKKPTNTLVK